MRAPLEATDHVTTALGPIALATTLIMLDELKTLFKHTTIYGMGSVLGKMVGFFMIPFYTHYLTPADYGTLELLDLTLGLTALSLTMWMNASIIRHYYDYDNDEDRKQVIGTVLILATVIGVVVGACGITWSRILSQLVLKTQVFHVYITLISLSFFVSCLNAVSCSYLRAKQRSMFVVSGDLINLIVSLSLNIYFVAFRKVGVIGILYSSLLSNTLVTSLLTAYTLWHVKLSFSFDKLKAIAAFGAPLVVTSLAAFTVNFSDRFFLRHFSTISTVGIYALGYKFGFMLSFLVVQPFDMIWGARMYEIAKREDGTEVMARIFGYYTLALVTAALVLSLGIKEVIAIIAAPDFHAAYRVVPVVALAYVCQGMNRYFLAGIYIAKRTVYLSAISAVSMLLNLVLNYFLISRHGMMGAAWATALSFLAMAGLSYFVSQRVHPVPYSVFRLIMPLTLAALLYLGSTLISASSLALGAMLKGMLLVMFPVGLYLFGFFDGREVEKAREIVHLFLTRYGWRAAAASGRG